MKTDGYIFTPELLQWRYFHRPVLLQVLIHVLLSSAHNEASSASLSVRELALRLHTTPKAVRCAIDTLASERIITKCSAPRASTIVYVNSSHPLSHCIIPWQNTQGAQATAQLGTQMGTQIGAQISHSQVTDIQVLNPHSTESKGADKGADRDKVKAHSRAQQKPRAQQRAQIGAQLGAQIESPETPLNKGTSEDFNEAKGADGGTVKGTAKGTLARKGKKEKSEKTEKLSPEPPIKEKKEQKEKRQKSPLSPSQKKEKEKKSEISDEQYSEVLRIFNNLFLGTPVKTISKITPERKRAIAKFINDYSFEDVATMMRKAYDSDLLMGREDGRCSVSFNWLFTPAKYEALIEGSYDNPAVSTSGKPKLPKQPQASAQPSQAAPQPQQEETSEQIEARLARKQEQREALEKQQTEELRQKYLSWIESAKQNPSGSMAKMVRKAYEDGTLAQLGIVYNPSVAEEEQSLADLDEQTQSYLQSLISD